MDEMDIPKLRADIDVIPTRYRGENVLVVKDSLGLIKDPILLRGLALQLVSLIDGKNTIQDIQLGLMRLQNGVFVRRSDVEALLSELDTAYLIDSARYRRERERIAEEYARLEVRNAFLAGKSYPQDPEELKTYLQAILDTEGEPEQELERGRVAALVAPHIDLEVGKKIYAKAYKFLTSSSPKKVLLLGTGHSIQGSFFSLTEKDFATPLGRVKTDRVWMSRLKNAGSKVASSHDFDHRSEHSLEFQLLFLQHMFGLEFCVLPVLCGSFQRVLPDVSRPAEIQGMADFLSVLEHYIKENPSETLVVAGVDFSHIGPKFGHRYGAPSLLAEAKEHDHSLLEAICQGDLEAFWFEIQRVDNRYNVCGFSALAVLLELLAGRKGRVLGYDFWVEEATQSAVSFAALALLNI
jgi:AmmeMemoRadiSam system protein B